MPGSDQRQRAGLGVGWLPRQRILPLLERGELVEKETTAPREPNILYVGWLGDHQGRAMEWWLEQLRQPSLAARLVHPNLVVAYDAGRNLAEL